MAELMIEVEHAVKSFRRGVTTVTAVDGISLCVERGEFIAIMGRSGSGKSTLLHLMSGLLTPTSGVVRLLGRDIGKLSDNDLTLLRRDHLGFVFQFFNLLPTLTAAENVALPLLLARAPRAQALAKARDLLAEVGLTDRAGHKPDEMSGGQMQRVAIARALVNDPPLLFADEPTGNLDTVAGEEIMAMLKDLQHQHGRTIIMVTHDAKAAAYGDRMITLRDGRIHQDLRTNSLVAV